MARAAWYNIKIKHECIFVILALKRLTKKNMPAMLMLWIHIDNHHQNHRHHHHPRTNARTSTFQHSTTMIAGCFRWCCMSVDEACQVMSDSDHLRSFRFYNLPSVVTYDKRRRPLDDNLETPTFQLASPAANLILNYLTLIKTNLTLYRGNRHSYRWRYKCEYRYRYRCTIDIHININVNLRQIQNP